MVDAFAPTPESVDFSARILAEIDDGRARLADILRGAAARCGVEVDLDYLAHVSNGEFAAAFTIVPDPPDSGRFRDRGHRSGRKTLVQLAQSGDLDVRRQATWGMSVQPGPVAGG